ncbi:MAG: hypothetical protein JW967_02660 [Dehalococcoidales bacterium]|nr:hypothetical protein [Dehalococcoidales bacterium]
MKRNWLMGIAVALLLLPEPFTTPFGAVLLAVSFLIRKQRKDKLSDLEVLVRRYLQYKEVTGFQRLGHLTKPVIVHRLVNDARALRMNTADNFHNRSYNYQMNTLNTNRYGYTNQHVTPWHDDLDKKTRAVFQRQYITDSRRLNNNTARHILRASFPQYNAAPSEQEKVVYHTIRASQPANVYHSGLRPIGPIYQQKVIHHTLKRA